MEHQLGGRYEQDVLFRGFFDADISLWDTARVTDMSDMFRSATSFSADLSKWNVAKVETFASTFYFARSFNADISAWDISSAKDLSGMFSFTNEFNVGLSSWDTRNANDFSRMFSYSKSFNSDISLWSLAQATDLSGMFENSLFNTDVSSWDVRNVKRMDTMFANSAFNQSLCAWDLGGLVSRVDTFRNSPKGDFCDCVAPAGSHCIQAVTDRLGTPCPAGQYCLGGVSAPEDCAVAPGRHCPRGEASPAGSACPPGFYCLGRQSAPIFCGPGTFQDEAGSTDCKPCPRGTFNFDVGASSAAFCAECPQGSFGNSSGMPLCDLCPERSYQPSPGASSCQPCPAGSFCPRGSLAPVPCPAGTRARAGAELLASPADCFPCEAGTFQSETGQTRCLSCAPGGFCPSGLADSCGGGFVPCPAGTFNPALGSASQQECQPCAPGTFSARVQATESGACQACQPGTYGNASGLDACRQCPRGTFARAGSTACSGCEKGKHANNTGQGFCALCPYPLSSGAGSALCSVCSAGFVLVKHAAREEDVHRSPDKHCRPCPASISCPDNTSLHDLPLPAGLWRASSFTSALYPCFVDAESGYSPCGGGQDAGRRRASSSADPYCVDGHRGPVCRACLEPTHFYAEATGRCEACSLGPRLGVFFACVAGAAALVLFCFHAVRRFEAARQIAVRLDHALQSAMWQAKFKVLISFIQVFNTLENVYGVRMHPAFTGWFDAMKVASVDLEALLLPGRCVGSMRQRLILNALWPVVAEVAVALGIAAHAVLSPARSDSTPASTLTRVRDRAVYAATLIAFMVLPSVSRSIFAVRECVSFQYRDDPAEQRSYLLADLDVQCSSDDPDYRGLALYFWLFFVLWPVLIPMGFLWLVLSVQASVSRQHMTDRARAVRFLWRDYKPSLLFWEVVDTVRKEFLTALILFVDTEHGSSKHLRLALAATVSAMYATVLAALRPFKRTDDLYLACTSNLLLACCFITGTIIKLCEEQPGGAASTCQALVGLQGSYTSTVWVVVLTAAMLVVWVLAISVKSVTTLTTPTMRLVSTGRKPTLELPPGCSFHCFASHSWQTGQDQTHSLVRRLELLMPSLRVWLDVDRLASVGKLEAAVAESAVFLLFMTSGYFQSANCRRELYAALALRKPIIVVHEADEAKGGATLDAMQAECRRSCVRASEYDQVVVQLQHERRERGGGCEPAGLEVEFCGPEEVERRLFAAEPVVWVRVQDFQLQALKSVCLRVLQHLPGARAEDLSLGLRVPGELGPLRLEQPLTLLYCEANEGAREVAAEVGDAAQELGGAGCVTVLAAEAAELQSPADATLKGRVALLLYLNQRTFLDPGGRVRAEVTRALQAGTTVTLVHEQSPLQGACRFADVYDQAPEELLRAPYNLFQTLAVPLYPTSDLRSVSLKFVLRNLGARPLARGAARTATGHGTWVRGGSGAGSVEASRGSIVARHLSARGSAAMSGGAAVEVSSAVEVPDLQGDLVHGGGMGLPQGVPAQAGFDLRGHSAVESSATPASTVASGQV